MEKGNEYVLTGAKEKFANARSLCPGMPDEMYALTDYLASVTNDKVTPDGLNVCLVLISDDIQKNRNGFGGEFPNYLRNNKSQIIAQMANFPQVVDAIAGEVFAQEYRRIFKALFNFEPPKRANAAAPSALPKYIEVAVDWWANAIQSPKYDNGSDIDPNLLISIMGKRRELTEDEIRTFKHNLAYGIEEQISKYGSCTLSVDYNPCPILANAGDTIGLNAMLDYPWKTTMVINNKEVLVSSGYDSKLSTLWSKEQELDATFEDGTIKR